ncbi:uncharacterized protein LOC8061039 [Sorghum bicolor]|uniref:Uncharacterized protein n=1 Tax=Sorghum bicolor TaxID=4558 RepID=C5XU44_SORBI|nr:uncharacterized protein LOC8061039 [Sorghum bicolor]EES06934.1 hypothetical protein SORBI_3004G170900 [Sorghum bicolor]|eukprot:XP_002453958.1 uncharacterized protein LOC8061039 [Sorghum bicolor]
MGAVTTTLLCNAVPVPVRVRCSCTLLALLLCVQLLHTSSQAFKLRGGGGYEEKKVPLAVIVPDPSPELSGLSPSPLAAPAPVHGGGGDDMRPKLPTERSSWRRGRGEVRRAAHPPASTAAPAAAPSLAGPARAPTAGAPAPDSGGATAIISSSPAVAVPRGVTDTATILPMPAPGEKRQEVGSAASVEGARVVPLLLGIMVMMAFFGILI